MQVAASGVVRSHMVFGFVELELVSYESQSTLAAMQMGDLRVVL